jgi:hypothetical protein
MVPEMLHFVHAGPLWIVASCIPQCLQSFGISLQFGDGCQVGPYREDDGLGPWQSPQRLQLGTDVDVVDGLRHFAKGLLGEEGLLRLDKSIVSLDGSFDLEVEEESGNILE